MGIDINKDFAPFDLAEYDPSKFNKRFGLRDTNNKLIHETQDYKGRQDLEQVINTLQALITELKVNYGVLTPNLEFVIGESTPGRWRKSRFDTQKPLESIYIVAARVNGKSFDETQFSKSELNQARVDLDHLVTALGRYIEDKYKKGGIVLGDIIPLHQYMYGTVDGNLQKSFYLVDIDPGLISPNIKPFNLNYHMSDIVLLAENIIKAEHKLKGSKLTQARTQLNNTLNTIPKSDKYYFLVEKAQFRIAKGNLNIRSIFQEYI